MQVVAWSPNPSGTQWVAWVAQTGLLRLEVVEVESEDDGWWEWSTYAFRDGILTRLAGGRAGDCREAMRRAERYAARAS